MPFNHSIFGFNVETDYRFRMPMAKSDGPPDLPFSCIPAPGQRTFDESNRIYATDYKNRFGESSVLLYRDDNAEIMRFPRIADFILRPESITCELLDPTVEYMVEICLLGHVFGYFLERSGFSPIHGASVEVDGAAALLVDDRTGGKSTLSASFVRAGYPLIADDISALEIREEEILCRRGYPQVKLTPEQAKYFVGSADGFPLVHPAYEKLSVPVSEFGRIADGPAEVARIYVLERQIEPGPVRVETIPPGEALIELIRHTFITEIIDATDLKVPRMKRLARIAQSVPVKRLRYPTGYESLPKVHEAVLADLDF